MAIDETQQEFTISGRFFHIPQLSGVFSKAQMHLTSLPQLTLPQPEEFGAASFQHGIVVA